MVHSDRPTTSLATITVVKNNKIVTTGQDVCYYLRKFGVNHAQIKY